MKGKNLVTKKNEKNIKKSSLKYNQEYVNCLSLTAMGILQYLKRLVYIFNKTFFPFVKS